MITKILLGAAAAAAIGASVLGVINKGKTDDLRIAKEQTETQLANTKETLAKTEKKLKETEETLVATQTELEAKKQENASLAADLRATKENLAKKETELADTAARLATTTTELDDIKLKFAAFQKPGEETPFNPKMIEELQEQVKAKEAETNLLADQVKTLQSENDKLVTAEKRRQDGLMAKGLTGKVVAVNQAWNFVVLNLGDRQGVTENGEMIIRRGNTMIGKLRISSVEPSTSIGDIVPSSVPRGVQVQPGDLVVYALP